MSDSLEETIYQISGTEEEIKNMRENYLKIAHIVSYAQCSVENEEFRYDKKKTWHDFDNLFFFELTQVSSSSSSSSSPYTPEEIDRRKRAMLNMLFKLDSIHDFFGERTSGDKTQKDAFKNNILTVLGWDSSLEAEKFSKTSFENDLFMWLILSGLKNIYGEGKDDVSNNSRYTNNGIQISPYYKKIMITLSIQDYLRRVSRDQNKSAFTIDAGLVDFNTFRNFLMNLSHEINYNTRYHIEIIEKIAEVDNIPEYSDTNPNIKTKIPYSAMINQSKICMKESLLYQLKNTIDSKQVLNVSDLKDIFLTAQNPNWGKGTRGAKKKCDDKTYISRYIGNIQSLGGDIDNFNDSVLKEYRKKYPILNIFIDACNDKNDNSPQLKVCKGDLKETEIDPEIIKEKIFKNLDKYNKGESKEFHVIAPQKFDSNRTTGGGWGEQDLSKILHINGCRSINPPRGIQFLNVDVSSCRFQVLDDICYFYSTNDNKFIFKIDNSNYPIQAIVVMDNIDSYNIGTNKRNRIQIGNNLYDTETKTLFCKNAPGVTELYNIYNDYRKYFPKYNETVVLKNILTIKRAGDYSQIWFCQRYNQQTNPEPNNFKLFFMSNDRMSASFCLIEQVPFVCMIRHYGVYYNPFGEELRGEINYTEYSHEELANIILQKNEEIFKHYRYEIFENSNIIENVNGQLPITCDQNCDQNCANYLKFIYSLSNKLINDSELEKIIHYQDYIYSGGGGCVIRYPSINIGGTNNIGQQLYGYMISFLEEIKQDMMSAIELTRVGEEIEQKKEESKNILRTKGVYEMNLPHYIIQKIQDTFDRKWNTKICRDLKDKIITQQIEYNKIIDDLSIEKLTASQISEYNVGKEYIKEYENIKNCLSIYKLNNFIPEIFKDENSSSYSSSSYSSLILPGHTYPEEMDEQKVKKRKYEDVQYPSLSGDTSFLPIPGEPVNLSSQDDMNYTSGFSFDNGLTYYNIHPTIPDTINMNNYKHANRVYVMDKAGVLKIKPKNDEAVMYISDKSKKYNVKKEYTDGTKISYKKFNGKI